MLEAGGCDLVAPAKAEQSGLNGQCQLQIWAGIGIQDVRHGTPGAVFGTPSGRVGVLFVQATLLDVMASVEILVVVTTFIPSGSTHSSLRLS
ncbi:MAG: hypothetical protein H6671_03190 [Anaerolineaceae bacterium]|nr:hypothetical protein [Anaerolineaceae bacterium]